MTQSKANDTITITNYTIDTGSEYTFNVEEDLGQEIEYPNFNDVIVVPLYNF